MKYLTSLTSAAVLSVLAVAGAAQASSFAPSDAIQSVTGGQYSVVRIDLLDDNEATNVGAWAAYEAGAVQQAVRSNASLVSDLQAKHVQINNIVAASETANGSVIFYLR